MTERRGRGSKGRPRKKVLLPEAESDLLDEVQRLRELNEQAAKQGKARKR